MTNSIKSQSLRKFPSNSRTCFKAVCVKMPICSISVVSLWVCFCGYRKLVHRCSQGSRLTDSEPVACPRYQNKSCISCFVNPCLCPPRSHDCQVTFRKAPSLIALFLSACRAKASLLPFFFPLFLLRPFSFTAEKLVHCDSECSSTAQWVLFEMRFERVSVREKDREPRAAERLDE